MKAISIITNIRVKYADKYMRSIDSDKDAYINWLQDEYAELAMQQANGLSTGDGQLTKPAVRQRALEWWSKLPNKTKKSITDSNIDILMKGIPRTWQRLTGREIEKLYVVSHVA